MPTPVVQAGLNPMNYMPTSVMAGEERISKFSDRLASREG
jgi:hypothetical protein